MADDNEVMNPYLLPVMGNANLYQVQADNDAGFISNAADFIGAVPNFAVSTIGAAIADTYNSTGAIQKFFGGDGWETDTHDIIDSYDSDAADYYAAHKGLVDGASLLATSIIPGTLGIKALRAAQAGASSSRILRAVGLDAVNPTKLGIARKAAAERAAVATNIWDKTTGELGKAVAIGVASNVLDMAAFGTAAMFATNSSPLYEGADAWDLTKIVAQDALIFGGIAGGLFSAGKTFYTMRGAAHAADMKTVAARNISTGSEFDAPAVRIAQTVQSLAKAKAANGGVALAETDAAASRVLNDFAQSMVAESDDGLRVAWGNMATRFKDAPVEAANFFGKLTGVRRIVQPIDGTAAKLTGQELVVDMHSNAIYARAADAPYHLGDNLPASSGLVRGGLGEVKVVGPAGVRNTVIKATSDINNITQMQASYFYAATVKSLLKEVEVSIKNIPMAERMIEEAVLAKGAGKELELTFLDAIGNSIDGIGDAIAALRSAKEEAAIQMSKALHTPETIAATLNVSTKFLENPATASWQLRSVSGKLSGMESVATFLANPRIAAVSYDIGTKVTKSGRELKTAFARAGKLTPANAFDASLTGQIGSERLVTSPMTGANTAIYEAEAAAYIENVLQQGRDARHIASQQVLPQLSNEGLLVTENELLQHVQEASRTVNAQTMLKSADNPYGTLGSFAQKIGSFTKRAGDEAKKRAEQAMSNAAHKLANDVELGTEWQLLQAKLGSTQANYVLDPAYEAAIAKGAAVDSKVQAKLIRQDIAITQRLAERAEATGKKYTPVEAMEGDAEINVSQGLFREVLAPHVAQNNQRLINRVFMDNKHMPGSSTNKALEHGLSPVYNIPVDTAKLSHFVFVRDKSRLIGSGGGVGMLLAKDAEQLMAKQGALVKEFGDRFEFINKGDLKSFNKAKGEYDYSRGMNESFVNSALRRSGRLADLVPTINAKGNAQAAQEFLAYHQRAAVREVRDAVEMRFDDAFKQLDFFGEQYTGAALSKFGTEKLAAAESKTVRNPYRDLINMALDKGSADEYPLWRELNSTIERSGDAAFTAVRKSFEALVHSPLEGEQLLAETARLNKAAEAIGLEPLFTNMAVAQFGEQLTTRPVMRKFIAQTQAILNGTMLGADWIQAINNTLGQVMFAAEFRSLIKQIERAEGGAGALAGLTKVKIPGLPYSIDSAVKLHAGVSRAFLFGDTVFDDVARKWVTVDRNALRSEYTEHGLLTSISKQYHQMIDDLTLSAKTLTDAELNTKLEAALDFARKWTGNNVAEEYTRFVAAHAARKLTDAAMAAGLIKSKAVASTYWNTAVNRVHGVNIASQRAVVFQGVIGQSIGMFMTYQHNLMQQLFRYASAGDSPAMVALAASQFGLYGAQGLPAFNAVATHLVGNAPGNPTHTDPYSYIAKHGGEVAEWVLYGAGSNALGFIHPDLKFNLYSRGDINPRQMTVFPTSLENTVVYTATLGAIKNMFDVVGNIAGGADVGAALAHGLAHNNLNRPLSGVGSLLLGFQSDNAGKWIGDVALNETGDSWDKLALSNYVRIAGAKPLDDAAAADAMYRSTAYKAKTTADIRELAESMRLAQTGGELATPEQMQEFMQRYAKLGGNIKNFRSFAVSTYKTANANQVAALAIKMRDQQAQHVAAILGATRDRAWLGDDE